MEDKPLGLQTFLDSLYVQLFLQGLVAGLWITIAFTLIVIGHQSWAAGSIFGYGSLTFTYAFISLHVLWHHQAYHGDFS